MTNPRRIRRRQFLVGTGVVLAQTALSRDAAHAQSPGPTLPDNAASAADTAITTRGPGKAGVAPGYITSGRGQNSSNPYFQPLGGPSNKRLPRPKAAQGKGVDENDQGENQQ